MPRRNHARTAISAAALLTLLGVPVHAATLSHASAATPGGSIAFLRAGNVWVARPDGSHLHRVTHDGTAKRPYLNPAQADNGSIVAIRNYTTLVHVDRNGKAVSPSIKVATGPSNNFQLHTLALGSDVSPDGTKVAVSVMQYQGVYDPSTDTHGINIEAQTIQYWSLSPVKKLNERSLAGTYLENPSWVDNGRILMFAPYNIAAAEVYSDTPGLQGRDWFADTIDGDDLFTRQSLDKGELTRQGDKLALIRGTNLANDWRGASLQLYSVRNLTDAPTPLCSLPAQHGAFGSVTWSPDGGTIAWSDSNGIWESAVDGSSSGCGLRPRLIVRGGSSPNWGPAAVR